MWNFVFQAIMASFRKNWHMIVIFELNFYNFQKKMLMLIRVLATTLGLAF
jgi:hypothetical protein